MLESSVVDHAMSSFGRSSVITESHSTVLPAGAFTTQWDLRSLRTSMRSMFSMKRGRFLKSRQKA